MNKRPKSREETPKEGSDRASPTAPQQYATAMHKTQGFLKHFQRNLYEAGGYATGRFDSLFIFKFRYLYKIPRAGPV
jgi:hypothetical protein